MRLRIKSAALLLVLLAASCAPLSRDTAFHGEPGKGFVIVAAEGHWYKGGPSFFLVMRRLNAAKDGFIKPQTVAYFTGQHDYPDDEFARPKSANPAIRLAGLPVVPGDYAIVSFITDGYGEQGPTTFIKCFALGSVVYTIKEGVVNVVHYQADGNQPRLDADVVKNDIVATLAAYPNITAPLEMAQPIGSISFTSSTNILGNPTCTPEGPLTFTRLPVPMGSSAQ